MPEPPLLRGHPPSFSPNVEAGAGFSKPLKAGEPVFSGGRMGAAKVVGISIVTLILLGVGGYLYREYQKREALRSVEIHLEGIQVRSIGATSASLEIRLRLHNPNTTTATLDRADYSVYGNGIHLGDGKITEKVDIPPGSTRTVTTPFDLSYSGLISTVWEALKGENIIWRITGVAYLSTPFGTLTVPFEEEIR